jgi:hypothetical protein
MTNALIVRVTFTAPSLPKNVLYTAKRTSGTPLLNFLQDGHGMFPNVDGIW